MKFDLSPQRKLGSSNRRVRLRTVYAGALRIAEHTLQVFFGPWVRNYA